jgi:prophage tail gpP-like protein
MPNDLDNIALEVGGVVCTGWDQVDIDSEILTPADAWSLALFGLDDYVLPESVKGGADVTIKYLDQTILVGVVDTLKDKCGRQGRSVRISGRDLAGQLLDCSVDIFQGTAMTLNEIVHAANKGSANPDVTEDANGNLIDQPDMNRAFPFRFKIKPELYNKILGGSAQKTAVEPGESIWAAIQKVGDAIGQYIWFDPDGTLIIGNPIADEPQPALVPELVLLRDGTSAFPMVLDLDYSEDVTDVYSELHVLSQDNETGRSFSAKRRNLLDSHRTLTDDRKAKLNGAVMQDTIHRRLRIVISGQAASMDEANALADKTMHDANLNAYTLTAEVQGWTCATGEIWRAGWLLTVKTDAVARVSAEPSAWVVFGRTLRLSRTQGMTTTLKLKRVADWMQPVRHVDVIHDAAYRASKKAAAKAKRKAATGAKLKAHTP